MIGVCIREVHMVPTMQDVSYGLRWNEREYFELFGIYSAGHNQLQRLTTDYKARGHPLRKDFPATGYREVFLSPFRDIIEETKAEFIQEYRSYEFYITWEKYLETFLVLRPDLRFEYDIGNDVIERLESLIDSRHYIYPEDYDPFEDSDTDSDREMVDMALIEKKEKKQPVSGHDTTADTSDSEGSDEEEVITDGILDAGRRRRRRRYDSSSDDSTTESSSSSKELSEDDDWPNDGSDAESSSSSD